MDPKDMTHGELYAAAEAAGMTFKLAAFDQVCIGSGLLGWTGNGPSGCVSSTGR